MQVTVVMFGCVIKPVIGDGCIHMSELQQYLVQVLFRGQGLVDKDIQALLRDADSK